MARFPSFSPPPDFPYLHKSQVAERIGSKTVDGPGGCRLWAGYRRDNGIRKHKGAGVIRVTSPTGKGYFLPVHKLTWWAEYGDYVRVPRLLLTTCGNPHCLALPHLQPSDHESIRRLRDHEVVDIRRRYWDGLIDVTDRERAARMPSLASMVASAIGINLRTVESVMAGRRVRSSAWKGSTTSVDDVRRAIEVYRPIHARRAKERETAPSCSSLSKNYGVGMATMCGILQGFTYRHLEMPASAKAKYRREERLRRRRANGDLVEIQWDADGRLVFGQAPEPQPMVRRAAPPTRVQRLVGADDNVFC